MSFRFPRAARPALAAALAASSSVAVCRADLAGIEHGRIGVVQLDNGNGRVIEGPSSIALTRDGGSRGFSIVGGNRADYTVAFGNDDDTAAGVMLTSVRQNGRDNTAGGGPGLSYATAAAEEAGEDRPDFPVGRYYIATSAARGGGRGQRVGVQHRRRRRPLPVRQLSRRGRRQRHERRPADGAAGLRRHQPRHAVHR